MSKAVLCKAFGPPESLIVEDAPDPSPGEGEVKVRVAAAALNFFDALMIEGRYQARPPFPFSPGAEFAGVVEELGPGVEGLEPGARIVGRLDHGACRAVLVAPQARLARTPEALSDEAAAGLIVVYG